MLAREDYELAHSRQHRGDDEFHDDGSIDRADVDDIETTGSASQGRLREDRFCFSPKPGEER